MPHWRCAFVNFQEMIVHVVVLSAIWGSGARAPEASLLTANTQQQRKGSCLISPPWMFVPHKRDLRPICRGIDAGCPLGNKTLQTGLLCSLRKSLNFCRCECLAQDAYSFGFRQHWNRHFLFRSHNQIRLCPDHLGRQ